MIEKPSFYSCGIQVFPSAKLEAPPSKDSCDYLTEGRERERETWRAEGENSTPKDHDGTMFLHQF